MLKLSDKIAIFPRVSKNSVKYLKKLGLETIQDLLFYLPFRYEDFGQKKKIADLKAGENVNIQGEILLIQNRRSRLKKMNLTEALVADDSETIKVIWFNQPFLTRNLKISDRISLAGKISENQGQLAIISPQYEKIFTNRLIHTNGLVPMYHLTSGLTQKQLRFIIKQAIFLADNIEDCLPLNMRHNLKLLNIASAVKKIHFPNTWREAEAARKRLIFSELFFRQLKSQLIKKKLNSQKAPLIEFQEEETRSFVASLPFQLTPGQKQSAWEILKDLKKEHPMNRLLEGDVGSGKTVVAAIAIFNTALNGKKSALMAPTEILARQHFSTISKLLKNKKRQINIALLTGSKKDVIDEKTDLIIGTHAIIQKKANKKNLALAIVDEQHRFGVKQRQKILDFNHQDHTVPHFLSMTATPIPRSLALAIYGDLDLSIIKEMPIGRKKIITRLVKNQNRDKAYSFIAQQIEKGRQSFVICPLIENSDRLEVKSAKTEYDRLRTQIFPNLKIGLLHGKMKNTDKEKTMQDFSDHKIDILVSTSIIEVGIDVPNASIIAIEGAERFGLAQLHQFRGRVGRSEYQSYCLLFPSQENIASGKTIDRLSAMEKYNDGFSLAKMDLKLRGAGDLYGSNQSGFNELQIASLFDYELIKRSNEEAAKIIQADPELKNYPLLKKELGNWEKLIHLE
jgi:ATP-dependent DNA helicase RecG